uniref:Uncharacterized protein n=1 Tax=Romanomermis culicivorax TaxID=13658 RepID=A0A915I1E5_ROMCU
MSPWTIILFSLFIHWQPFLLQNSIFFHASAAGISHAAVSPLRHNPAPGARRCVNQCYLCLNAENKSFDQSQEVCLENGYLPADDEIIYAPLLKRYCWAKGPTWTSLRYAGRGWFFVGGDGRPFSIKENTSISHFFTTSIPSEITDYKTCAILNGSEIRNHNCHSTDIQYVMCRKNCDQIQGGVIGGWWLHIEQQNVSQKRSLEFLVTSHKLAALESAAEPMCFHRYVNRNLTIVSNASNPNLVLKCVYRRSSIMCPDGHAFPEFAVAELCDESLCQSSHFLASTSVLLIIIGLINGILILAGCGLFLMGSVSILKAKSQLDEIS